MNELTDNVFIKEWYCTVDELYMHFYIYYIDHSKHVITFVKGSSEKEVILEVLHIVEKKLEENGWIKKEQICNFTIESMTSNKIISLDPKMNNEESKYNPSEDPYYKNEDLYVP